MRYILSHYFFIKLRKHEWQWETGKNMVATYEYSWFLSSFAEYHSIHLQKVLSVLNLCLSKMPESCGGPSSVRATHFGSGFRRGWGSGHLESPDCSQIPVFDKGKKLALYSSFAFGILICLVELNRVQRISVHMCPSCNEERHSRSCESFVFPHITLLKTFLLLFQYFHRFYWEKYNFRFWIWEFLPTSGRTSTEYLEKHQTLSSWISRANWRTRARKGGVNQSEHHRRRTERLEAGTRAIMLLTALMSKCGSLPWVVKTKEKERGQKERSEFFKKSP